jgi:putative spermidine/putrescine transport system permease protein
MGESHHIHQGQQRSVGHLKFALTLLLVLVPYMFLLLLSLGSGWSFPGLLPDRIDFGPWRELGVLSGLSGAALCGILLSVAAGMLSAVYGLILSRIIGRLQGIRQRLGRAAVLFPFAVSPAVAAVCLFDLMARLGLAGTFIGVLLCQSVFGSAAAAVILLEGWGETERRREELVRMLGGSTLDVWRHAIWPHIRGLLGICFLQTALFSWLDYGIVLHIGGGRVPTLTLRLFTLIREASVNYAALATLLLVAPALAALTILLLRSPVALKQQSVTVEQQR